MESIDPRVNRLPKVGQPGAAEPKAPMDQFGTFEVFVQPRDGRPFQHEGAVHAPDIEMAYILAKETFTRRFTCSSLYVADTKSIFVSPLTEGSANVYDQIEDPAGEAGADSFEIYHLLKRGKQHIHAGRVMAANPQQALSCAKKSLQGKTPVLNAWALRSADIRFTSPEERDLWITLPEKKFRDAAEYKGGDRLKDLISRLQS